MSEVKYKKGWVHNPPPITPRPKGTPPAPAPHIKLDDKPSDIVVKLNKIVEALNKLQEQISIVENKMKERGK